MKKKQQPTNLRHYRKRTERNLLIGVVVILVVVGAVLTGLIYNWGAALMALLCLLPGALVIVGLWGFMWGVERFLDDE